MRNAPAIRLGAHVFYLLVMVTDVRLGCKHRAGLSSVKVCLVWA